MVNNQSPNSTTASGTPPCLTALHSSKVNAALSLSCRASQTALALQSNAAFTGVHIRATPAFVVREKGPLSLVTPELASAHQPELSPLCIPAVSSTLSADTPSTTAVASPESDSSHIGSNKELSSGSQEDGELEDEVSSDIEIFLSSLGLENAVPGAHTSTAPDSEHVPDDSPVDMQEHQKPTKVSDIRSPQLPPAPLQQTIPLPDVASDSEGPSAPIHPASSQPVAASKETIEEAEASTAAQSASPNSRDIYLNDCINIDNTHKTPNVYINGLPPHFPEEQLYALAAPFGAIRSVRTFTRHVKESESGYGFVLFETVEAAEKCIISLRRYRNLHPTFSKQAHKIPGIAYTQLPPPQDHICGDSTLSTKWGQKGGGSEMSFKERMESLHDPTSTNLYMEGLPLSIDEATLAALVSPHRISSSRFFQTRLSNPPRIIAFVRLESRAGAEEIVERLHGRMVRGWNDTGSRISVRFADTAEQRELRRSERVNKEGEQSPARLTIAQAALLNMRGQELRQRPMIPVHQSLPDRLDRLRADSLYSDFPNNHLPSTGLTVDYSLTPSASYVSPRLQTSASTSYVGSQQRDPISPNTDPAMLTLLDSLRGGRSFHNGDYARHDNDIQYNIRPHIPSRTSHVLDDFGFTTPQYPLRNGYTPTEEYIMRAHAESTALRQGRRPPPIDLYRRRSDSDAAASITVGVRGQRAQASTITIPQQKTFAHSNVTEAHNVSEDNFQSSAPLVHELRPRTQQLETRQDSSVRHKNVPSHVNARLSQPIHSKHQQAPSVIQPSLQNEQYPAGHTRCSTLPHRSSSTTQHQRHYQHSSMSVPSTTHTQDAISAILSSMNSSSALANSKSKPSNNETTTDHVANDRNESSQLKISNRLSFDSIRGATQLEKHNARLIRDSSLNEVEQSSSSLTSPALTYSSHTPSTLSPATPFFGSFASQSDGFEQQGPLGTDANKLKVN